MDNSIAAKEAKLAAIMEKYAQMVAKRDEVKATISNTDTKIKEKELDAKTREFLKLTDEIEVEYKELKSVEERKLAELEEKCELEKKTMTSSPVDPYGRMDRSPMVESHCERSPTITSTVSRREEETSYPTCQGYETDKYSDADIPVNTVRDIQPEASIAVLPEQLEKDVTREKNPIPASIGSENMDTTERVMTLKRKVSDVPENNIVPETISPKVQGSPDIHMQIATYAIDSLLESPVIVPFKQPDIDAVIEPKISPAAGLQKVLDNVDQAIAMDHMTTNGSEKSASVSKKTSRELEIYTMDDKRGRDTMETSDQDKRITKKTISSRRLEIHVVKSKAMASKTVRQIYQTSPAEFKPHVPNLIKIINKYNISDKESRDNVLRNSLKVVKRAHGTAYDGIDYIEDQISKITKKRLNPEWQRRWDSETTHRQFFGNAISFDTPALRKMIAFDLAMILLDVSMDFYITVEGEKTKTNKNVYRSQDEERSSDPDIEDVIESSDPSSDDVIVARSPRVKSLYDTKEYQSNEEDRDSDREKRPTAKRGKQELSVEEYHRETVVGEKIYTPQKKHKTEYIVPKSN